MSRKERVLLIEDAEDIRAVLTVVLERAGLHPLVAADGKVGLRLLHERRPDCVILDVGLPNIDGWEVLARIRDISDVPVMMLTARHLEEEKVRGLQAGADDYMTKPFGNQELVARVQALLRRGRVGSSVDRLPFYSDGLLTIDPGSHQVTVDEEVVELTSTEFRLLSSLVAVSPQVLSPVQLLEAAWRDPAGTGPDRVKYVVHRVRKKLGFVAAADCPLQAVRGVGYRYVKPT